MPPIHEDKLEGTIDAVVGEQRAGLREEGRELGIVHFAASHREVAVLNRP